MARKQDTERLNALTAEYKKLAKRADQRLKRLEDLSKQKGFKNVTKWAYGRAMKDIEYWSGEGTKRFNRDIPTNIKSLQARINDVKHFLEGTKTSTKSGIMSMYKRRTKTTADKYGAEISWEKAADFYESKMWQDADKEYGSKTAIKAIGEIQKNEDQILQAMQNHKSVAIRLEDKKVQDAVNGLLKKHGLTIFDMY